MHRRRTGRTSTGARVVAACLLLVAAAGCTTSGPTTPSPAATGTGSERPPPTAVDGARVLLHHSRDARPTPADLSALRAEIAALPFDAVTVELPWLSNHTLSAEPVTEDRYAQALAPMPPDRGEDFVALRMVAFSYALDDDELWATISANLAALSRAAAASGAFRGLFLDTEYYGEGPNPWDYGTGPTPWEPSPTEGALPGRTPEQASDLADARGRQVAAAVASAWPEAVLLTTYGPWVGDPRTAADGFAGLGFADVAWANELMRGFTLGIAATSSPDGLRYVDGGELYQLRDAADFSQARAWIGLSTGVAPATGIAFGVYDSDITRAGYPTLPAPTLRTALEAALATADRYVWLYSDRFDWLGVSSAISPPPADLLRAVAEARERAGPSPVSPGTPTARPR